MNVMKLREIGIICQLMLYKSTKEFCESLKLLGFSRQGCGIELAELGLNYRTGVS